MDIYFKKFLLNQRRVGFLLVIIGLCSGCTSQQLYATGQSYQRNQCLHLADPGDRDRCLGNAEASYDEYKRKDSRVQGEANKP
jgi:hypothetical protein